MASKNQQMREKYHALNNKTGLGSLFARFEAQKALWLLFQAIFDYLCLREAQDTGYRLWMVHPKGMCDYHLQLEHEHCHAFADLQARNKPLDGYRLAGVAQIHTLVRRHDELLQEMTARRRDTPTCTLSIRHEFGGFVDIDRSHRELHQICSDCRRRFRACILCIPLRPKIKYAATEHRPAV